MALLTGALASQALSFFLAANSSVVGLISPLGLFRAERAEYTAISRILAQHSVGSAAFIRDWPGLQRHAFLFGKPQCGRSAPIRKNSTVHRISGELRATRSLQMLWPSAVTGQLHDSA